MIEVTEELVEVLDEWSLHSDLSKDEHDRMMKAANDKGRWIEDKKWRDADGPLAKLSGITSTTKS